MKFVNCLVLATIIGGVAPAATAGSPPAPLWGAGADLIMSNGKIRTPGGWAEALAIRDGVIVAVGEAQAIASMRGKDTQLLDLGGATVLPGLHDLHVHPLFGGISETRCKIEQGSSLQQILERVGSCVDAAGAEAWITGGQWDAPAIGRPPHRTLLDAASPHNPVLLDDTSGHSAWANSAALAAAGIDGTTPDPQGGIIERDASGAPTGVLREDAAIDLVRKHVPEYTEEQVRAALGWALHEMLSHGITSFVEASLGFAAGAEKEIRAYASLADAGVLKQHARLCLTWQAGSEEAETLIRSRNLYARDLVRPDCVKIFLDGVPTDSHTAAMLQPYTGKVEGRTDEASRMGMLLVDQDVLDAAVTRFDAMGLTVKFHAAGDAAVRAGLHAIGAARKANGFSARLHDVGHCTFVARSDLALARTIGATFEVSPYLWGPSPINDSISEAIGAEVIKRVWPVREMIDAGALVVPGSDWSVVPSVNPWIGIETLVTREQPGGSGNSFGKAEAISLEEAIDMFTVNSARHLGVADKVGRIAPGLLADVIVLEQNPFEVPITEVHKTRVRMSFVGGRKVFDAGETTD
jgi:predicted amidohydrolase YtcJ